MEYLSDFIEEISSEYESVAQGVVNKEVAIALPVEPSEPSDIKIPAPGAESPESTGASPLVPPALSEAWKQGRVGIEIPLEDNMVAPQSGAGSWLWIKRRGVWGWRIADIFIPSTVGLEVWRDSTRQHRGQTGFVDTIPPTSARFVTFLESMCRDQWEEQLLSPAGESALFKLQAALIGWNSQTFSERRQFLRQMEEWYWTDWRVRARLLARSGGFWEIE